MSTYSSPMNNGTVSVVAQVWVTLAHLVKYLLEFIPFGERMQFGAAFRRQAGVASLGSDRWGCVGSVDHWVMLPPFEPESAGEGKSGLRRAARQRASGGGVPVGSAAQVVSDGHHQGDEVVDGAVSGGASDGVSELSVVVDVFPGVFDGTVDA